MATKNSSSLLCPLTWHRGHHITVNIAREGLENPRSRTVAHKQTNSARGQFLSVATFDYSSNPTDSYLVSLDFVGTSQEKRKTPPPSPSSLSRLEPRPQPPARDIDPRPRAKKKNRRQEKPKKTRGRRARSINTCCCMEVPTSSTPTLRPRRRTRPPPGATLLICSK